MNSLPELRAAESAVEMGDFAKAIEILTPLCEFDVAEALQFLGSIYQVTARTEAEGKKALEFLSKAASLGSGLAAHNLATAFATGLPGIAANPAESQKYLCRAKSLGVELLPSKMYE